MTNVAGDRDKSWLFYSWTESRQVENEQVKNNGFSHKKEGWGGSYLWSSRRKPVKK